MMTHMHKRSFCMSTIYDIPYIARVSCWVAEPMLYAVTKYTIKKKVYVTRPVKTGHVGTQNLITFSNFHDS